MENSVIWWIRRDLRLHDNHALLAALASGRIVILLFILDDLLIHSANASEKRLGFLWAGLNSLDQDLQSRGSRLIVRNGPPLKALRALAKECNVESIFAEADFSPYARKRDKAVALKFPLSMVGGSSASHPDAVLKSNGQPYLVYSPYMRAWKAIHNPRVWEIKPAPAQIPSPKEVRSDPIPSSRLNPLSFDFISGESSARERLFVFLDGEDPPVYHYAGVRDRIDLDGTASISPYLRFGMLSSGEIVWAAAHAMESVLDVQNR